MARVIHRAGMRGQAYCGSKAGAFGDPVLRISTTGAPAFITCPDCVGPSREEQRTMALAALNRAAERYRVKHR